ncbi:MAG: hypothetical protein IKG37_06840 [Solobacterium sp.]|jgi:hypothetical protein|nr:hypothetical protein [Solobacterium sp.]
MMKEERKRVTLPDCKELEELCTRNGRVLRTYSNGDFETFDMYDGCDWQRFKSYEECLEWEKGYLNNAFNKQDFTI